MMRILLFTAMFFTFPALGWYPTDGDQEFRLVAKSNFGIARDWTIEGQMFKTALAKNMQIVTGFRLDKEDSALGGSVVYPLNEYISLAVTGDVNQKLDLGSSFWVHGNFNLGDVSIKPFVKVDHKKVGEIGIINYFDIGGVKFHIGGGIITQDGITDLSFKGVQSVIVIGTSISIDAAELLNKGK